VATVFTTPVRVTKLSSENSKPQPKLNSGTTGATGDTNPLKHEQRGYYDGRSTI